jgi:amino acid efflux transporter
MSAQHVAAGTVQAEPAQPAPAPEPSPGPATGRPTTTIATAVATGVLGAGMLVMPPVVAGMAGTDGLGAWSAHILIGGSVSLLLALLVRGRSLPAPLAVTVGDLVGPRAQRLVDVVYAVAFTAGQAAIAWFTATCVLAAVEGTVRPSGATGLLVALAVLVVALCLALSPLHPPAAVLRLRPWLTGATGLLCAAVAWPAAAPDASTPLTLPAVGPEDAFWVVLAALFFAGVGWETVTHAVPIARTTAGRTAAGVALGASAVAAVYLGLAAVRQVSGGAAVPRPLPAWVHPALGAAVTVLLASYCFTNIRTAARIAARLRPGTDGASRPLIAVVGAVCCGFAVAGARTGAVPLLLLGPAAGAFTAYVTGSVAALRHGGRLLRCGASVVLLALVAAAVQTVRVLFSG